ncbi:translation initiation factor IF-2-like [Dipodomys spectabilis]|uniref:translation initiation factor IF-2-like n=1 Tax=Dipodomys spectabilis TaxID=105255 RepID=UPI001C546391|nr:translation initiation factor IF-2-like [Dipodomys spectabilis]
MKKSGAELGQQAQATAATAGARAGAAAARGALRGMRQSLGGRGARGGPGAPAGARGPALRLPHPARPAPCAALGPRRAPEERGRRFPGGGRACPNRRLPKKRLPRSGSQMSGSPASASYMEDPPGQRPKGVRLGVQGFGGDFLGAGGDAGTEDAAAAAAAAAPRGADSAEEGGAVAGPRRGARSRPPPPGTSGSLAEEPLVPPPLIAAGRRGAPHELPAPTRLRLSSSLSGASLSPVRPLLTLGSFCRRRGLAAPLSGALALRAARRRRAGSVSGSSLWRGERTQHGARLARLARLGDRSTVRRAAGSVAAGKQTDARESCSRPEVFEKPGGPAGDQLSHTGSGFKASKPTTPATGRGGPGWGAGGSVGGLWEWRRHAATPTQRGDAERRGWEGPPEGGGSGGPRTREPGAQPDAGVRGWLVTQPGGDGGDGGGACACPAPGSGAAEARARERGRAPGAGGGGSARTAQAPGGDQGTTTHRLPGAGSRAPAPPPGAPISGVAQVEAGVGTGTPQSSGSSRLAKSEHRAAGAEAPLPPPPPRQQLLPQLEEVGPRQPARRGGRAGRGEAPAAGTRPGGARAAAPRWRRPPVNPNDCNLARLRR